MGLVSKIIGLVGYVYVAFVLLIYFPVWSGNLQSLVADTVSAANRPYLAHSVDFADGFGANAKYHHSQTPSSVLESPNLFATLAKNSLWWLLFVLQHTAMARPAFKKILPIPSYLERTQFVVAAAVCLHLFVLNWQPIPTVLWHLEGPLATIVQSVQFLGWAALAACTFQIDHFDLLGVRQAFQAEGYTPPHFVEHYFYKYVRHPLMVSFWFALFSQPTMTVGHLYFCILASLYILMGVSLEEKDLLKAVPEYKDYVNRVPAFCPAFSSSKPKKA